MSRVSETERISVQAGFTLLEILVALAVFALASMIAYRGLDAATSTKSILDQEIRFWRELGLVFDRMEIDLFQSLPHPLYENDEMLPPMRGNSSSTGKTFFFELVRQDGERSPIRVLYSCDQGNLMLRVSPVNHKVSTEEGSSIGRIQNTPLLRAVESCDVAFLNANNAWFGMWPGEQIQAKPRAIRIHLAFAGRGRFERIFYMP